MSNYKRRLLVISVLAFCSIFSTMAVAGETNSSEEIGNWKVDKEVDPLTDETEIFLSLPSNESIESFSVMQKALIIRLSEGTTDLYISWDKYLADNNEISYRFGDGGVEESTWIGSQDGTALFFPDRRKDLESFVKRLIKVDRFVVGISPYGKKRQTAVFDVRGLGNALLPNLEQFGWEKLEETI